MIWIRKTCRVCSFKVPHRYNNVLTCLICTACGDMTAYSLGKQQMTMRDYIEKLDNYWGGNIQ